MTGALTLDRDLLFAGHHVHPFAALPGQFRVIRINLLGNQVEVIVLRNMVMLQPSWFMPSEAKGINA